MTAVMLVLSLYTMEAWEPLGSFTKDVNGAPFTVESCTDTAKEFLAAVRDQNKLDDMIPAVSADCRLGLVKAGQ